MGLHVLVVDDEPDFVELVAHTLQAKGFEVSSSLGGMDGMDKAVRLRPDALLLDVMLPDLDGFTVCEILRRQPAVSHMAVLMLTCLGGTISRMNGIDAGADDYLTKPFQLPTLPDRIRTAVRQRARILPLAHPVRNVG
ncbi:MAG: response regulator [Verrucomicrobia bacterium]|jgi:two-component system response regulator RpaA|nr:response regulator [Verrucomicrobiota bacterium]